MSQHKSSYKPKKQRRSQRGNFALRPQDPWELMYENDATPEEILLAKAASLQLQKPKSPIEQLEKIYNGPSGQPVATPANLKFMSYPLN